MGRCLETNSDLLNIICIYIWEYDDGYKMPSPYKPLL